jgi:preprotein translocase subunit YajC
VFVIFGQTQTQSWTSTLIFLAAFFAIFYFMVMMPRKKQEKKHSDLLQSLKVHDKIVTIGGLYGEVKKIKDQSLMVKIAENAEIEILKSAIAYKQED